VHVQETIRCPFVERAVLDVLAHDAGTLLVAATEKPAAVVAVRRRLAPALMIRLVRYDNPYSPNPWS